MPAHGPNRIPKKRNAIPWTESWTDGEYPITAGSKGAVRCKAKRRDGGRCRRWAILGAACCRAHGGVMMKARQQKAGKYAQALKSGSLATAYKAHLADENYKDLRDELAVMRSFTQAALLALNGVDLKNLTSKQCVIVMTMVSEVRALVEAVARVDQRINVSLTVTDLHAVVGQIFELIQTHVTDPAVLRAISDGLEALHIPTTG